METIKGIAASTGIAIGRAVVLAHTPGDVAYSTVSAEEVAQELARVDRALADALEDLRALGASARDQGEQEAAKIFEFHMGLLQDPSVLGPIRADITRERVVAEYAISEAFQKLADTLRAMEGEVFQQKAADVVDLERRLLRSLGGEVAGMPGAGEGPFVVVAHELTPSDVAEIAKAGALGFATDAGGLTGHTSIIARALSLPAVVGCGSATQAVEEGDEVIIDCVVGALVVRPDEATRARADADRARLLARQRALRENAGLEAVTTDGTHISLQGNIEFPGEVASALSHGGEGVGLYRTEYLHLTSPTSPSEEDHYEAYARAIELSGGRPLTIRTVDLGADKLTQEHLAERERNPFLGLRSIRFSLQNLPMFKAQLRAILRASALGPLRVMFPLVSNLMELRQARILLRDLGEELEEEGIPFDRDLPVGVMIEVPSAAIMARVFAGEAGFLSIGTNDLTQYTLAVDRSNERVARLYTPADPAVLSLIKSVVRASRHAGKPVSCCGEMAGDPLYTPLLIGMGLRTLSMSPGQIPLVKRVIRNADLRHCEAIARRVGSFDSQRQVVSYLRDELRRIDPEALAGSLE